jgi:hypothetical protein
MNYMFIIFINSIKDNGKCVKIKFQRESFKNYPKHVINL